VVGRPSRRGLAARISPGIVARLEERAEGVDLLIVDLENRIQ
jgi:hypothetical protein